MKELTQEELETINEVEENSKSLGLVNKIRDIYEETFDLQDERKMKFNLPESKAKFISGNGEGIWGIPLTDEDYEIYEAESVGETFKVVLLNQAFTYPFPWGSIITVETRGSNRPVLSYDWFDGVVKESSNGEMSLAEMLED